MLISYDKNYRLKHKLWCSLFVELSVGVSNVLNEVKKDVIREQTEPIIYFRAYGLLVIGRSPLYGWLHD